jgi:putative redox protein
MSEQAKTETRGAEPREVVVEGSAKGFAQNIALGDHRLVADEPIAVGGTGTGPGPYDLLLAALGSCTSMTVGLYGAASSIPSAPLPNIERKARACAVFSCGLRFR